MAYQLQPQKAIFDSETGFATVAGWTEVYHYNETTGEFAGVSHDFIYEGVSLPAHSCADAPTPAVEGKAIVRKNNKWVYFSDYRNQKIYSTETGKESIMREIGDIPTGYTLLKPGSEFDMWNGKKWVLDTDKQHQFYVEEAIIKKDRLISDATNQIAYLQDAIDTEIATDDEKTLYLEWKKYRALLNRIDIDAAPEISWPEKPEQ